MDHFTAGISRPGSPLLEQAEVHCLFDGSFYFHAPRAMFEEGERIVIIPELETSIPVMVKIQSDTSDPLLMRVMCVRVRL